MIKKTTLTKKVWIALLVLVLLSPLGVLLPEFFHTEGAWGEWSIEKVEKQTGHAPAGMQKDANLWKAPIRNYSIGSEKDSLPKRSGYYILSGAIGLGTIALLTFAASKLISKK
jgi:cobalt/nickel transport protein